LFGVEPKRSLPPAYFLASTDTVLLPLRNIIEAGIHYDGKTKELSMS
jgi:hypothetical protein